MIESGYILRPANPLFITFSLLAATLLHGCLIGYCFAWCFGPFINQEKWV